MSILNTVKILNAIKILKTKPSKRLLKALQHHKQI